MATQYHSLFTNSGLDLLRESIQNGTKIGITHMSFGDGNGVLPIPDPSFNQLQNEVYKVALNRLSPSKDNSNWLEADGIIPSAVGGFNIREVGLWAGDTMVAYANYPPTFKPTGDSGTAQIKTIRIILQIDNTSNFELKIDESVVLATQEDLRNISVKDESVKLQNGLYQSDKNALTVDILDFVPKSEWEDILNNVSNFDCTPALINAVSTGKKVTIGQSGTYKLITPYIGTSNFDLEATAPNVILDGNDNSSNYVITNSGSVSKLTATFKNPSKFDISITLSDVTGLKAGDWLCFYCPTDFSYSEWRNIYRAGEWKQIRSIVGNIVWFTKPFYDSYAGLILNLYKLNSVTCKLKNLKLLRTNGLSGFAKFSFSSDTVDENIELDVKVREGILYDRCINQKSINAKGVNIGTGTGTDNDYGIVYANCQHARVHNADIYSRRHAIALGGGNDICSVPVSDFRCYTSVLSCDPAVGVGAADMHGNIRDSSYEDCTAYGGTNIGGGDECYYKRCKIYSDDKGVCGFGREIIGGNMGWIDCEYHSIKGNPQPSGQAVISFGGNDVTTITDKTTKDVTLHVSGKVYGGDGFTTINSEGQTVHAVVAFCKIRNRGTNKKINAILDKLEFNNSIPFSYLLNMDVISGTAESDKIIIDNITGKMPTANIFYSPETLPGQSYINKPMRLQKVVGKTTISTIAGNASSSPVVSLPFSYPRKPLTQLSMRGQNGVEKELFGGRRNVTLCTKNQTVNSFQASITADQALTADDIIEVIYSTEIREC